MSIRLLCLTATTFLLAGCNSAVPGTTAGAAKDPASALATPAWQLSNSTVLSLVTGSIAGDGPTHCMMADFRIPAGTDFVVATFEWPPNVNPSQPGVGQMGILLRAPNETRIDSRYQVGILDPKPGKWTVGLYGEPLVVNQAANVTVTLRGHGNMAMQELRFWKEAPAFPWEGYACPGPG